jgi:hypothetical protein
MLLEEEAKRAKINKRGQKEYGFPLHSFLPLLLLFALFASLYKALTVAHS